MTFKPFYVWPNLHIPFRHYFQSQELNIFIIENIVHNFNWLNQYKDKINDSNFFFVYCGWFMDHHHAEHYDEMFNYLKLNKSNFYFMFNSEQEKTFLQEKGFIGDLINHNCWLDENIIKCDTAEKIYDAILVSRQTEFKRHYLAKKVSNLALVAGGENYGSSPLSYPLPPHVYNNQKPLSIPDVCHKISQSYCGLMLSAEEGACFSSSEYLLCGIPVVSTKSLGGRDFWYNNYNSIICEDNEDVIAEAVAFFRENHRDPMKIRTDHILLAKRQRGKFISVLESLFDKHNLQIDAKSYFDQNYSHKLIKSIHTEKLKEIFI